MPPGSTLRQPADEVTPEGWDGRSPQPHGAVLSCPGAGAGDEGKGLGPDREFRLAAVAPRLPGGIAYGASKGGVEQMTRAMAEAWSRDGINANALAPGFFHTELTGPVFADPERVCAQRRQTCIGRNGEMAEDRRPAAVPGSEASAYVTGQVLFVDGGFTAK
jgi:NAD(P)-dependent dehydrogenase (short-subunit alcohol dehydrogenase family)